MSILQRKSQKTIKKDRSNRYLATHLNSMLLHNTSSFKEHMSTIMHFTQNLILNINKTYIKVILVEFHILSTAVGYEREHCSQLLLND